MAASGSAAGVKRGARGGAVRPLCYSLRIIFGEITVERGAQAPRERVAPAAQREALPGGRSPWRQFRFFQAKQ